MPTRKHHDAQTGTPGTAKPAWSEFITAYRKQAGLTCRQSAESMGVTQQTWAGIEAGTRTRNGLKGPYTPKDATLHRVATALGMDPGSRRRLFMLASTHPAGSPCQPWQTRLRVTRVAAGLTLIQAASIAGVTADTYRKWESRDAGVPRQTSLRQLLNHLGLNERQVNDFMADVPVETRTARAPQQPTSPVEQLPRWSRLLTEKRLEAGLYLSHLDQRLGQQSVVRRFELGGWPRADGRLSVPSMGWLDRIASALDLSPEDRTYLHFLADHERLAIATQGKKPFHAEVFNEARRAVDVSRSEADARASLTPGTWAKYESATAFPTPDTLLRITETLPIRPLLAAALTEPVPQAPIVPRTSATHAPPTRRAPRPSASSQQRR